MAAFARMTVEDSRKLLPPEFYPSWVVFSERQKLSYNITYILMCFHLSLSAYWKTTKVLEFGHTWD